MKYSDVAPVRKKMSEVISSEDVPVKQETSTSEFSIFEPQEKSGIKSGITSALSSFIPGGQIAIKKPALAASVAGAVEAPIATAAGMGVESLARQIAPEKYKDLVGTSAGVLAGTGVSGIGKLLRTGIRIAPGRIINSMIGPKQVAFKYGKNPGETVARIVKPANSLEELGKNIDSTISTKMNELETVLASPKNSNKRINFGEAFSALDSELNNLKKTPGINAPIISKIETLRNDLLGLTRGKGGKFKRSLTSLSPAEAVDIKRTIGNVAKWTGGDTPPQLEGLIHNIYGKMKRAIEVSVPETKAINDDIAGLIGASKAIPGAIARGSKTMLPLSAKSIFSTLGGGLLGGGTGSAIGFGTNLALSHPATGTRIAKILSKIPKQKPSRLLGIK